MPVLIATELFTLLFAMNTLSAVRAFVGGESLWSKAQKNSILALEKYAAMGDEKYFRSYEEFLHVPLGDHLARLELKKPVMDSDVIMQGFVAGKLQPSDVPGMVK